MRGTGRRDRIALAHWPCGSQGFESLHVHQPGTLQIGTGGSRRGRHGDDQGVQTCLCEEPFGSEGAVIASDRLLRATRTCSLRKRETIGLLWVLAVLAVAASAACGGSASETPAPTQTLSGPAAEVAAHLSEKTMRMWEVYNAYDLDGLSAFYEESYWQEEEEELRSNMEPFKQRGTTFTAEETSPPTEIEPGKWQVKHKASFSGGSVNMVFVYEQFGEQWLFTYAEAQ